MKYLLFLTFFVLTLFVNAQDKMGFGNDPEGADSAGFGLVTTWVKPSGELDSVLICGEYYKIVVIGTQSWLQRNLHCNDSGGGIYSYANSTANSDVYGFLYTWAAAVRISALIEGWHLPTNAEYITLANYLGGQSVSGGKMKEEGTSHWQTPNTDATNESGFAGLPGGRRLGNLYSVLLQEGNFWTSSEITSTTAYGRILTYDDAFLGVVNAAKTIGYSVRLIKD